MMIMVSNDDLPIYRTILPVSVNLMGLLKWRDNLSTLKHYLLALTSVDGEEVVKVSTFI